MKNQGEVLTQAEIEALLASLPGTEGGPIESAAVKASSRPVRSWDFRKPDKFSKDHMRSLLALHQNLSRLAATGLAARLRTGVTIKVTSVDQALYEEYIDLLPSVSVLNVVSLRPLAGNMLFERGYYVQSVTFPAVPYHAGVLRIQVNANHLPESIDGLLDAMEEVRRHIALPGPRSTLRAAA